MFHCARTGMKIYDNPYIPGGRQKNQLQERLTSPKKKAAGLRDESRSGCH